MIKFVFKWTLRVFILLVVLAVVAVLSIDPILRIVIQNRIRAQTGMDAQIGKFSLGLFSPTLTIKDFKIYNPPDFGGTPFLDIPEIHVEYDRAALRKSELHVTLLRFNLGEFDIVKNQAGQTNILSLGTLTKQAGKIHGTKSFTRETGLEFTGVDVLNVSLGRGQYIDLADQHNNRSQDFGISNCVIKNVKAEADLTALAAFIALRSGNFFDPFVDKKAVNGKLRFLSPLF